MPKAPKPIASNTFEVELLGKDKVEIGDKESADFKPHIKLNRWDGECFIKVSLPTTEKVSPVVEGGKVKFNGTDIEAHFYPLEPRTVIAKDKEGRDHTFTQNELGGFEFEIILKKRPLTNKIVLDIETQGLNATSQPYEIPEGSIAPDNVKGSIVFYHATRVPFHKSEADAEKYKACKAFHIYRSKSTDAVGDWRWNQYSLQPGRLIIIIDQDFLDNAVYPVIVDPDFGDTSTGGSWADIADSGIPAEWRNGSSFTMPAGGGTANYIKAYLRSFADWLDVDCKTFINQEDSGGVGTHAQIATKENLACSRYEHWEEFTLADEDLTESVNYILSVLGNGGEPSWYQFAYDIDSVSVNAYRLQDDYSNPDNPWVVSPLAQHRDYSIYCNYDVAAPPGAVPQSFMYYQRMRRA